MLLATSVLILQQYPRQYRWPCHRCISGIREPGSRIYAGLSLCSRKLWCGTSTLCTGLLMQHLSVPPHQCGGGGMSINERWLYLQATVCTSYTPWTKRPTYSGRFPPLFLDQAEAWRAKDNFFGDPPPPPSPYLKVWIQHLLIWPKLPTGTKWAACNTEVSVFPRGGGELPIMVYMGRLCPKGVPFPGLTYMKG